MNYQVIFILFISFFFTSVSAEVALPQNGKVISTTGMINSIVSKIVPKKVLSEAIMGSGTDPHLFKPSRSDIVKFMSAKVIFYNGNHLEGRMLDAFQRFQLQGKSVIAVTEKIAQNKLIQSSEFAGNYDPHVWMDPKLWFETANIIKEELLKVYSEDSTEIEINANSYFKELEDLNLYIEKIISSIPKHSKVLITAHDAFGYFGKRYGIEVMGIQGISTDSEASINDIENLVNLIVTRKIPAVFVESTVSEKNVNALLEGAKSKKFEVKIGGNLYSDAMGKEGTYEGTYIGMMDHNATSIVRSLGGVAPEKGMKGMLVGLDK
jgi:manganese/zinc/iron transport system substrate-binding protein